MHAFSFGRRVRAYTALFAFAGKQREKRNMGRDKPMRRALSLLFSCPFFFNALLPQKVFLQNCAVYVIVHPMSNIRGQQIRQDFNVSMKKQSTNLECYPERDAMCRRRIELLIPVNLSENISLICATTLK